MLVLTRKIGESFYVGDDIKVTLVRIDGRKARIAISAPSEVRIRREELPAPRTELAPKTVAPRKAWTGSSRTLSAPAESEPVAVC